MSRTGSGEDYLLLDLSRVLCVCGNVQIL